MPEKQNRFSTRREERRGETTFSDERRGVESELLRQTEVFRDEVESYPRGPTGPLHLSGQPDPKGHPTARPLKTKSIDYEKMGLVCGNDMATGQFARSLSSAPSIDLMQESSNYSNSDDVPINMDDLEFDSRGGGTSGESSSKKKEVRKRARDVEVLVTGMKESAALVQHALDNLADSVKSSEPHKRIGDKVYRELVKIEGLTRNDIDVTHEWLTLRKEMATVFLSHGDKKECILRRLHRIYAASFP